MKSFVHPRDMSKNHPRDALENWRELSVAVPFLRLDPAWEIAIIPPFGGAAVRFLIRKESSQVSVHLDTASVLGCVDVVYWEVYPNGEGDNGRCELDDSDKLISMIREGLEYEGKQE